MSKVSKYVKLDKNILLEYIYNDGNLIVESYNILVNTKNKTQQYVQVSKRKKNLLLTFLYL